MRATDAIRHSLQSSQQLLTWLLSDFADAELLVRPAEGANHVAWQVGHLTVSERNVVASQLPETAYPEIPLSFADAHSKTVQSAEPPLGFSTRAEYVALFGSVRLATLAALATLGDDDLDRKTTGQVAAFAPTLGAVFLLAAHHSLMHAGQVSVVRRKLGKPVLF